MLKIHDKYFKKYISKEDIQIAISRLATQINTDFAGQSPVFVAVLNGSFMFVSDLLKEIELPCEITFMKVKSYEGMQSTGKLETVLGLQMAIKNRPVIIVEDIVDTGNTIVGLLEILQKQEPQTLKIATLLLKPNALQHNVICDYIGFEIPDKFVVGYGLDYDQLGRNYGEIYQLVEK